MRAVGVHTQIGERELVDRGALRIEPRTVEGEAVIDHSSHEARSRFAASQLHVGAVKDALTSVGVAGPLVEDQDAAKLVEVGDLRKKRVGEEVVDRRALRVARVPGAELPAGFDFDAM